MASRMNQVMAMEVGDRNALYAVYRLVVEDEDVSVVRWGAWMRAAEPARRRGRTGVGCVRC